MGARRASSREHESSFGRTSIKSVTNSMRRKDDVEGRGSDSNSRAQTISRRTLRRPARAGGSRRADGLPNFLGPFVQGPPVGLFVYVNSGTLAGQSDSCWTRRSAREPRDRPLAASTLHSRFRMRATRGAAAHDVGEVRDSCPRAHHSSMTAHPIASAPSTPA